VHIHVPYLIGTQEEQTVRWLHEGLNAFTEPVAGGFELLERFEKKLDNVTDKVIAETQKFYSKLRKEIASGRDRLLELSSFRPDIGNRVADEIRACEQSPALKKYLLQMFDHYGVKAEPLDKHSVHISPDQLFDDWFPLPHDGLSITFERDEALIKPDTILMSWDHPMVTGAGELMLGSERGSCSIAVDPEQDTPLKLQTVYVLETVAPPKLYADRFLPSTPILVTVDHMGHPIDDTVKKHLKDGEPWKLLEHEGVRTQMIPNMIEATKEMAEETVKSTIAEARREMLGTLGAEFKRLEYLKQVNDNIRQEELDHARKAITKLDKALSSARLHLDSIRVITAG